MGRQNDEHQGIKKSQVIDFRRFKRSSRKKIGFNPNYALEILARGFPPISANKRPSHRRKVDQEWVT